MKKRLLSVLLTICMVLALLPVSVLADGDFTVENGVLTKYNGSGGDVAIPSGITSIDFGAFSFCRSVTSVSIPSSVTDIKEGVFDYCDNLTNISVDSGNSSYKDVDGVLFSKDMTLLLAYPVGRKSNTYNIPYGVTRIGRYAFTDGSNLSSVTIPSSVKSIGDAAFEYCRKLSNVSIPNSVTSIEERAFAGSGLTDVNIPSSVTSIGDAAFNYCHSLTNISVDSGNTSYTDVDGVLFSKNKTLLHTYPSGKEEVSYNIPSGVTAIEMSAFNYCKLSSVNIPSSVIDIKFNRAFGYSISLTNINVNSGNTQYSDIDGVLFNKDGTLLYAYPDGRKSSSYVIPDGVTSIDDLAFHNNTSLTSVTIPISVTSIKFAAFSYCSALKDVYYIGNETQWKSIEIGNSNEYLTSATIHYGTMGPSGNAIIYDLNGGVGDMPAECWDAGQTVTVFTTAPTKSGYAFKGWSNGSTTYQPGDTFIMPDHEVTLTAVWEINATQYYLTYNLGGVGPYPSTSHLAGETINIPSDIPVKEGYKFKGWSDGSATYQAGGSFAMPNRNVTLTALWEAPSLSYDLNGGQGDVPGSVCIDVGTSTVIESKIPEKDGYTFVCWSDDRMSYQPGDTFIMPSRDVVLKAEWQGLPRTLRYNLDGGTGNIPTEEQHRVGDIVSITSMSPEKRGFVFAGWSDGSNTYQPGATFEMPNQNVVLVALWSKAAEMLVAEALKYVGYSEIEFEKATGKMVANGQWCSDFIGVCAELINAKEIIPREPAGWKLSDKIIEKGGELVTTPKKGDIATFRQPSGFGHVGIVCDVDDTYVYIVHGNWHGHVCAPIGYSSNGSNCIKTGNPSCGRWPRETLVNQGATIASFTRPNWAAAGSSAATKYNHVITFECPIDVSISCAGERLDSATGQYDASFGNMMVEKGDDRKIVVTLNKNYDADIKIMGTGEGTMTLTSTYLKDDVIIDTRVFVNVPISQNTTGKLYAYDSAGTDLLEIYSGEAFAESWAADKNERVFAFSKEATNWHFNEQGAGNDLKDGNISTASNSIIPSYSISVPASVTGGTLKVSPTIASEGSKVTITATAKSGYEVGTVTVTDKNGKEISILDLGDGKYSFVMPSGKVTVDAEFREVGSNSFTDVAENAWYYSAVKFVSENGLMNGVGNNLFAPDAKLSRAMLAQILYNREGKPSVNSSSVFSDVATDAWYADAVTWASGQSVVTGYGNGLFGPNDNITREQFVVMLYRYAGSPVPPDSPLNFTDADKVSAWALDAMRWAVEQGIINGKGNGILDPRGNATRAEAAQMLKNYLDK